MDRDDEGPQQAPGDAPATRGRPRRSGEGMDSLRHHLRDHLRQQAAEHVGEERSQADD